MPWKSKKQAAWGNSPTGRAKLGSGRVAEFNSATNFKSLPKSKKKGKRR